MSEIRRSDDESGEPAVDLRARGPLIVVTAMSLPRAARDALAERMGPGHVVRDIRDAGNTADIVLVPSSSPQLIGILRGMFPGARILVTELQDDEFGADFAGPVSTMAASGVDGYFVASSLDHLAAITYETGQGRTPIGALDAAGSTAVRPAVGARPTPHATLTLRTTADTLAAPPGSDQVIINTHELSAELSPESPAGVTDRLAWVLVRQLLAQGISVLAITDDHQWWRERACEGGFAVI